MGIGFVNYGPAGVEPNFPYPAPAASDMATAGTTSNVSAVMAFAGDSSPIQIGQVEWSYKGSTTPTGNITITGATAGKVRDLDITVGGLGVLHFEPPLVFATSEGVSIALGAGGAGVTGKLSIVAWKLT